MFLPPSLQPGCGQRSAGMTNDFCDLDFFGADTTHCTMGTVVQRQIAGGQPKAESLTVSQRQSLQISVEHFSLYTMLPSTLNHLSSSTIPFRLILPVTKYFSVICQDIVWSLSLFMPVCNDEEGQHMTVQQQAVPGWSGFNTAVSSMSTCHQCSQLLPNN